MAFDKKRYDREWRKRHPGYDRQYYHQNKDRLNHRRRTDLGYQRMMFKSHLKQKYGLTLEEFDNLVLLQEGRCALCYAESPLLWVDHDHNTGKVRGLLCPKCNAGIGFLRDGDLMLLHRAAEYLRIYLSIG